jgi:hypothetical protein
MATKGPMGAAFIEVRVPTLRLAAHGKFAR